VDRLDPALLRPGRIDTKVEYDLATKEQASALYLRFFRDSRKPAPTLPNVDTDTDINTDAEKPSPLPTPSLSISSVLPSHVDLASLSTSFAAHIPQRTFSTAELQGYLLSYKRDPSGAVDGVEAWVERELRERREREEREEARRARIRERRERERERRMGGEHMRSARATPGGEMAMDSQGRPASPSPAYVDVSEHVDVGGVVEQ
jgi:mitochondrial chaperone BCS1